MTSTTLNPLTRYRRQGMLLALFILIADQLLKYYIAGPLQLKNRGKIDLLPFFDLTWAENRGVSMGMFTADSLEMRWLLVALTALIAACVAVWIWKERARGDIIALSLVLGGALGNIVDRYRLGYVIDYADFHIGSIRPFFIFNLADAAISIGVVILLARAFLMREKAGQTGAKAGDASPDGE